MKENSKITIYQSGGKKKNKMSDLTGKDFESIRSELEEKYKQVTINYIEMIDQKVKSLSKFRRRINGSRGGTRLENLGK